MAKLYITEYADIRGNAAFEPAIAVQATLQVGMAETNVGAAD